MIDANKKSFDSKKNKKDQIKNKPSLTKKLLTGALALATFATAAKVGVDNIKIPSKNQDQTTIISQNEAYTPAQIPLSEGIEMPKQYIPQVPKTKGLDAYDPVILDNSQNWSEVDKQTAAKPPKKNTAKRSDK